MKNIFKKTLLVIALVGLITSCTNTDDFTDDSTMVATNPALDVALSFDSEVTLVEDDVVYPFTINLSEAQIVDVKVLLSKTSGTATEGEDFTFPHEIVIPRGSTSASGEIGIIKDTDPETTEDFTLSIASGDIANVASVNSKTVKFNIQNFASKELEMTFAWNKQINYQGTNYPTRGNIDFDIYISTSPFSMSDPFANEMGIYDAATGNEPEHLTISLDDFADGVYYLFADTYSNGFAGLDTNTPVPVNTTFLQVGKFSQTLTQDPSQVLNSDTPGYEEGGDFQGYIAKITIANGEFAIDGTLPTGKMAGSKNAVGNLSNAQRPDVSSRK